MHIVIYHDQDWPIILGLAGTVFRDDCCTHATRASPEEYAQWHPGSWCSSPSGRASVPTGELLMSSIPDRWTNDDQINSIWSKEYCKAGTRNNIEHWTGSPSWKVSQLVKKVRWYNFGQKPRVQPQGHSSHPHTRPTYHKGQGCGKVFYIDGILSSVQVTRAVTSHTNDSQIFFFFAFNRNCVV